VINDILFFAHCSILLMFGIVLSLAFSGLRLTKRTALSALAVFAFCGALQLLSYFLLDEAAVWKLYPLIIHLPVCLVLLIFYKKRLPTAAASVTLTYLCCQPAKWFGLLTESVTFAAELSFAVRIAVLLITGLLCIRLLSQPISEVFNKDSRSVLIFGSVPFVYYVFDYIMGVYTDLWINNRVAIEFLPFFLCFAFMVFCAAYYEEHEKKADAQRNEQIIRITAEQQAKEIEAIKQSNTETRLLRHDMRHILSSLALCIEQNDRETALKMISGFASQVEASTVKKYCPNDTLNYIISNFESKCSQKGIRFEATVEMGELSMEETTFFSIVSNALDNAMNAQENLPANSRYIKLMLKDSDKKLLLSVKNPYSEKPVIADGLPVADKKGHGYGTRSIRYMTEKLGGKCLFSIRDDMFVLQIVL